MKLDRNINPDGKGKYALIKLREVQLPLPGQESGITMDVPVASVDFGNTPDTEFFVIRLKDKHAATALAAYATSAYQGDIEYAHEVMELASRAFHNPNKKQPD